MGVRARPATRYLDRHRPAFKGPRLDPGYARRQMPVRHVQHLFVAAPHLFGPFVVAEADRGPDAAGEPGNGPGGQPQCQPRIDQFLKPAAHAFQGVVPLPDVLEQLERRWYPTWVPWRTGPSSGCRAGPRNARWRAFRTCIATWRTRRLASRPWQGTLLFPISSTARE